MKDIEGMKAVEDKCMVAGKVFLPMAVEADWAMTEWPANSKAAVKEK
jgi:hypothetical protein